MDVEPHLPPIRSGLLGRPELLPGLGPAELAKSGFIRWLTSRACGPEDKGRSRPTAQHATGAAALIQVKSQRIGRL